MLAKVPRTCLFCALSLGHAQERGVVAQLHIVVSAQGDDLQAAEDWTVRVASDPPFCQKS